MSNKTLLSINLSIHKKININYISSTKPTCVQNTNSVFFNNRKLKQIQYKTKFCDVQFTKHIIIIIQTTIWIIVAFKFERLK